MFRVITFLIFIISSLPVIVLADLYKCINPKTKATYYADYPCKTVEQAKKIEHIDEKKSTHSGLNIMEKTETDADNVISEKNKNSNSSRESILKSKLSKQLRYINNALSQLYKREQRVEELYQKKQTYNKTSKNSEVDNFNEMNELRATQELNSIHMQIIELERQRDMIKDQLSN